MTTTLELYTPRLFLRPLTIKDAQIIWPHVSNPLISEYMSWKPHQNLTETETFLKGVEDSFASGRCISWGVFIEDTLCGIFSLIDILKTHRSLIYNRGELAYWCGVDYQRKGIMTEAGQRVISYAFEELGLHKLRVGHDVRNTASEMLIKKLNFKFHYQEKAAFQKDGQWIDIKMYELFQEEYFTIRSQK